MRSTTAILIAALVFLPACRKETTPPQGDGAPSPRIVSFSPALTDMLYDMGLGEHVVGVTSYCRPPADSAPPVVGDRSRVSAEAILAVRPDVILIQQNPDDFGAVKSIDPSIRIEHFKIETLDDVASTIERIGAIAGDPELAAAHKNTFLAKLESVRRSVTGQPRLKVLFIGGIERPHTGGKGTFLDEMIRLAGGRNAAADRGYEGWKTLNRENILAMSPEVLICQVSPAREAEAREYWKTLSHLPAVASGRIFVVTDSRWTIPSMRSADFAEKLAAMVHPESEGKGAARE